MPVSIGGNGPITGVTSINTTVTDTELGYLDGVTSALQTQINAKLTTPGASTAYTPTLSGTGWTVGNGTVAGSYLQLGSLVYFTARFVLGSTSGKGSGIPRFTIPVTRRTNLGENAVLYGAFLDSGAAWYMAFPLFETQATVALYALGTNGVYAQTSSTVPFTWATNDEMYVSGIYEAA